jgi:hypothetical protein
MGRTGSDRANSALVGDPAIVARRPEALVCTPLRDGTLPLAAVEYVVLESAWDATHKTLPGLFGQTFALTDALNRYGLLPFYSHHWVWRHNPAGTFEIVEPVGAVPLVRRAVVRVRGTTPPSWAAMS